MDLKSDHRKAAIVAALAAAVLLAGCGRDENEAIAPADPPVSPAPGTPPLPSPAPSPPADTSPAPAPDTNTTPAVPPDLRPDPQAPANPAVETPTPGQANDHSNPAFQDGGRPDPQK